MAKSFAAENGVEVSAEDISSAVLGSQEQRGILLPENWRVLAQCPQGGGEVPEGTVVRLGVLKNDGEIPEGFMGMAVMDGFFNSTVGC